MNKANIKLVKTVLNNKNNNYYLIIVFIVGYFIGIEHNNFKLNEWKTSYITKEDSINICFAPNNGCDELIAREISKANQNIYVQAFSFTSDIIFKAILDKKQEGLDVKILVDKTASDATGSKIPAFKKHGIEVRIDKVKQFAHNKIILIDDNVVITGSYNFTNSAEKKNSENVVMINDREISKIYHENWNYRFFK
jgi:phospholipase D